MTRRRWIADLVSGNRAALIGDHANHLARVLRARIGQRYDVITDGVVRHGQIVGISDGRVDFELDHHVPAIPALPITVIISIFKFDRMEWALEKCTELGVIRIVPVIAERTDPHLAAAAIKRRERWHRLTQQASEQSRRGSAPEVTEVVKLKEAVALSAEKRILLAESEENRSFVEALGGNLAELALAIGPEGGWTTAELTLFEAKGWISATLGGTILRAETAAIAAISISVGILQDRFFRTKPTP